MNAYARAPWSKLPELLAAGMQILAVEQLEGAETLLVVDQIPEPPRPKEPPAMSTLGRMLAGLHLRAKLHRGEPQRLDLPGGLRIDLVVTREETRLLLARQGTVPSDQEWATVLAHFPYDPPLDAHPTRFEHNGWRCMKAAWPGQ